VAVKALFDYLKAGHTLAEFLDFPRVSREHAVAVIALANRAVAGPSTPCSQTEHSDRYRYTGSVTCVGE
jgi:hypothetical protein